MDKVILPRKVAEALDEARKWADIHGISANFVAWCIPNKNMAEKNGEYWKTLYDFGNNGGFLKLIDAIRYGYEVEPEPITVTVTAEMQDELRKVYNDCPFNEKVGFRCALTVLDLKIPGVNA